jgi:MSHA pilin protein MshD
MSTNARKAGRGFTLVEAIIAIMIVSVALAGVISVFIVTTQHSSDPMARVQAQIIAEGYLNEILLKRFYDSTTSRVCPGGAASHASYVCGYNGLSESPVSGYTATVTVTSSGATLGSLNNSSVVRVLRVDVAVSTPNGESLTFTGYRTNYECNTTGDSGCVPL